MTTGGVARQQIFVHMDVLEELAEAQSDRGADAGEHPGPTVLDALFGMGRLQELIDDSEIENIDINGCDRVWASYAEGRSVDAPIADSDQEVVDIVGLRPADSASERAFRYGQAGDRPAPARRKSTVGSDGGHRQAGGVHPTSPTCDLTRSDLVELGTLGESWPRSCGAAVRARKNIIVSGAMNSGKTTLFRALAAEIPPRERIVTIEQAFELGLDGRPTGTPTCAGRRGRRISRGESPSPWPTWSGGRCG